eukprot:5524129-Alexandrium_andersonii.AAC.1
MAEGLGSASLGFPRRRPLSGCSQHTRRHPKRTHSLAAQRAVSIGIRDPRQGRGRSEAGASVSGQPSTKMVLST